MLSCELCWTDPNANLPHRLKPNMKYEECHVVEMKDITELLIDDYETAMKNRDPLLFPGWMSQEEMAKLPGVILQTAEWDFMRFDAHTIIPKLKQAGSYLDHADYDVDFHGVGEAPLNRHFNLYHEDNAKAWKTYSVKGAPREFHHKS